MKAVAAQASMEASVQAGVEAGVDADVFAGTDVVWINAETPTAGAEPTVLSISQMAEKFSVTPRALRFYESKGLLSPIRDRKARKYGQLDQQHLGLILKGRRLGFKLAEIARMIDASDGRASRQSLKLTRQNCLDQIAKFSRQIRESLDAVAELQRLYASLSGNEDAPCA